MRATIADTVRDNTIQCCGQMRQWPRAVSVVWSERPWVWLRPDILAGKEQTLGHQVKNQDKNIKKRQQDILVDKELTLVTRSWLVSWLYPLICSRFKKLLWTEVMVHRTESWQSAKENSIGPFVEHECLIENIYYSHRFVCAPLSPINWFIWAIVPLAVIGNSIEAVQRGIAISRENAGCSCVTNASNSGAVDTVMLAIVVPTSAVVPLIVVPTILGPTYSWCH